MDPLSAFGIAANVFAVIGFASELVKLGMQIHKTGDSAQFAQAEQAAEGMQCCANLILNQGVPLFASGTPPQEDEVFIHLAEASVTINREIVCLLDEVRGAGAQRPAWKTFRQTFMTIMNRDTLDRLSKQLDQVRENLQLDTVVSIKLKMAKDSLKLDQILARLDDGTKASVPAFLDNFSALKSQGDEIIANQLRGEQAAILRHEQLLGTLGEIPLQAGRPRSRQRELSLDEIESIQHVILLSLWFPTMNDREEIIHEAYAKTYEWIYCDPEASQKPWDNLNTFLREDLGTYWITGKAGSGKSTLMKYIVQHPRTASLLQTWSGGSKNLSMAIFYFYYKGSNLQKSEAGVLRSLLHQLLYDRRELIKIAFPERYKALCISETGGSTFEPQALELKRALTRLIEGCPSISFFLAVDGLDEYEANSDEMSLLVNVFQEFTRHPNVKALLSSRPWVVFEELFTACPRLRLHELTRPDITHFVTDKINQHPRLHQLMAKNGPKIQAMMTEIVDASSGVFLWVYLVVRSLLEGLANYDSIEDLRARFLCLPVDLEHLYQHMWNQIPRQYRAQASRLLQLVENGTLEGSQLSLVGLSLAEEDDPDIVHSTPIQHLEEFEVISRIEAIRIRIASRCVGLVEVHNRPEFDIGRYPSVNTDMYPNEIEANQGYPHVAFLHRTVYEFVSSPDIRQELVKAAMPASGGTHAFYPHANLLRSAILRIKTYPGSQKDDDVVFPAGLEVLVYRCLSLARKAEVASGKAETRLLTELDRTMSCILARYVRIPHGSTHWSEFLYYQGDIPDGPEHNIDSFLSLCVRHGLVNFVRDHIQTSGNAIIQKPGRPLLDYALRPFCQRFGMESSLIIPRISTMVELLTQHGANPNDQIAGATVWTALLNSICTFESFTPDVPVILKALILSGADLQPNLSLMRLPEVSTLWEVCQYLLNYPDHITGSKQEFENGMVDLLRLLASLEQKEIDIVHGLDSGMGSAGSLKPIQNLAGKRNSVLPKVVEGEDSGDDVVKTGRLRNWWRRQKRISFR